MYENMSKECGLVQVYINKVLKEHWSNSLACCKNNVLISERSLYSTVLFSSTLRRLGYLSEFGFDLLNAQVEESINELGLKKYGADKLFFLDPTPEICHQRIKKRGREEESTCDVAYLSILREQMLTFLDTFMQHQGTDAVKVTKATDLAELKKELLDFAFK